jgi:hypothetical protein
MDQICLRYSPFVKTGPTSIVSVLTKLEDDLHPHTDTIVDHMEMFPPLLGGFFISIFKKERKLSNVSVNYLKDTCVHEAKILHDESNHVFKFSIISNVSFSLFPCMLTINSHTRRYGRHCQVCADIDMERGTHLCVW